MDPCNGKGTPALRMEREGKLENAFVKLAIACVQIDSKCAGFHAIWQTCMSAEKIGLSSTSEGGRSDVSAQVVCESLKSFGRATSIMWALRPANVGSRGGLDGCGSTSNVTRLCSFFTFNVSGVWVIGIVPSRISDYGTIQGALEESAGLLEGKLFEPVGKHLSGLCLGDTGQQQMQQRTSLLPYRAENMTCLIS